MGLYYIVQYSFSKVFFLVNVFFFFFFFFFFLHNHIQANQLIFISINSFVKATQYVLNKFHLACIHGVKFQHDKHLSIPVERFMAQEQNISFSV